MPQINRSTGVIPRSPSGHPLPVMGVLPGGGYEGRTRRLDNAVRCCAEWLAARFALDVEIRFNSDQLSGLAVVYPLGRDDTRPFDDPEIGLGAGLSLPKWAKQELRRTGFLPYVAYDERSPIYYYVLIHSQFLKDPTGIPIGDFDHWDADSFADAVALFESKLGEVPTP